MKNKLFKQFLLSTILTVVSFYSVQSIGQESSHEVILFDKEEILDIELRYDISNFRENREEYQEDGVEGIIKVAGAEIPVEVISRGQGSLDNDNPPFKLKFKKKNSSGTVFNGIKKIKAFPNPFGDSDDGEKYVLSNYLIYKLLEIYNPYSFKTKMLKIKYVDTSGQIPSFTSHSFLLEPNKLVAKRYDMEYVPFKPNENPSDEVSCDVGQVTGNIDDNLIEQMTAFQFLIGNFDHAIPGYYSGMFKKEASFEKNMKMLKDDEGKFYPVAYDFDFSGLIDRKMCWWEVGNVFNPTRSEHFENIGKKCNLDFVKKHLKEDLAGYYYKNAVKKEYSHFKESLSLWRETYKDEISKLTPQHLENLDLWINALDEILSE